jgi:DNA-binding response OmpR family regulator
MRAVLRRAGAPAPGRPRPRHRSPHGESVQLSANEYKLLVALAEDPSESCAKEELLRRLRLPRSLGSSRLHPGTLTELG